MQTRRARDGSWGTGRCKARMLERRMRCIIEVRPSRDEGLDDMRWDLLKGLDLWDSVTPDVLLSPFLGQI